jgi:hypothetical protein
MAGKWEWAPKINVIRKKVMVEEDWWAFKSLVSDEAETSLMVLANGKCLLCVEVELAEEEDNA